MAKSDEGKSLAEIYFGRLSDSEFVKLCKEILEKKNFTGLEILDGPGDRGNDIIGDEIIKTELGSEKRRCLIQCKHYIKSGKNVSDEEVRTTAGSLSQRNCKSALIITSTTLTPQAKHSILHFREKDEIPFYYWDAEYLSGLLNNKLFLEIVMKYNIGGVGLFGAVIRNIRELNMHVAVFSGCDANPLVIDFENYSIDSLSPKLKVERHPPFRFKVTGFNKASKVNFDRFGNSNYIQDTFWKKFALLNLERKDYLLSN